MVATEAGGSHPTGILSNLIFSTLFSSTHAGHTQMEQGCIPVGCVLPACCLYLPACTVQGGVCYLGVCSQGRCLRLGGVCYQGVSAPGGCLLPGGRCLLQGGGYSRYALRQTPPVDRMTNRYKNITLPQTSFVGGNNFVYTTGVEQYRCII